jgi:hypothetical protein
MEIRGDAEQIKSKSTDNSSDSSIELTLEEVMALVLSYQYVLVR